MYYYYCDYYSVYMLVLLLLFCVIVIIAVFLHFFPDALIFLFYSAFLGYSSLYLKFCVSFS